jgi:hypothetical protein
LFCANQLRTPQRARVCNSFGEPFFELQSIADVVRSNAITAIRKYNLVQEKQAIMFDSEQELFPSEHSVAAEFRLCFGH